MVKGLGSKINRVVFRSLGLGLNIRTPGLGFRVKGLGFRVKGLGLRAQGAP